MDETVGILTNIPAPYRLPIFDEINREHSLKVYFCGPPEDDRKWNSDLDEYEFKNKYLSGFQFGPIYVNTQLPSLKHEKYIIGQDPTNIMTIFLIVVLKIVFGKEVYIWTEDVSFQEKFENLSSKMLYTLWDLFKHMLYKFPSGFVALSGEETVKHLSAYGVEKTKIFSGCQVVPKELLNKGIVKGDNTEIDENKISILYLGYLRKDKNVSLLIDSFKTIQRKDIELVIVGTGPMESELKSYALGDHRIKFVGYVNEEMKKEYYAQSDVFVLPTKYDVWGLVVNEALHYGLPVIVSDRAGSAQLVDTYNAGEVVPSNSEFHLAQSLSRVIGFDDLREQYASNAGEASKVCSAITGARPFISAIND